MASVNERRFVGSEVRAQTIDGQHYLVGYAAKFGVKSNDLGGFTEVVEPRAFDRALASSMPVVAVYNHNTDQVLGTTKAGSLTLSADKVGLAFRCRLPDTSYARDVRVLAETGDANECSFCFRAKKPGGDRWDVEDGVSVRHLLDCDLYDVSILPTGTAAYPDTEVAVRSMNEWRAGGFMKNSALAQAANAAAASVAKYGTPKDLIAPHSTPTVMQVPRNEKDPVDESQFRKDMVQYHQLQAHMADDEAGWNAHQAYGDFHLTELDKLKAGYRSLPNYQARQKLREKLIQI